MRVYIMYCNFLVQYESRFFLKGKEYKSTTQSFLEIATMRMQIGNTLSTLVFPKHI